MENPFNEKAEVSESVALCEKNNRIDYLFHKYECGRSATW